MIAAVAKQQRWDVSYLRPYWPVLWTWAEFLIATLPDPGNQLCTDDFMGPSPHNVNLAAKGIVGLGAFAQLLNASGDVAGAQRIRTAAAKFANDWIWLAADDAHYRLQYDLVGTWSLKYNLLFDRILNTALFPPEVVTSENKFYFSSKMHRYGAPLDNRAKFTKTDWLSWMAAMADAPTAAAFLDAIFDFANTSPSRVPFTDWYDTDTGRQVGFQARPVVGGIFAHLLLHT